MNTPLYLLAGERGKIDSSKLLIKKALAATGSTKPKVAYVGAASGDNPLFFMIIKKVLTMGGAGRIELAKSCSKKAGGDRFKAVIEEADIVFISGGDVKAGMDVLQEKGLADFLIRTYQQGKPFFGISAGSIMIGSHWVYWEDENDDNSARLFPCLGFAPFICDTHDETCEWEELKLALRLSPAGRQGYGLPAGSALGLTAKGTWEALGCPVNSYLAQGDTVRQEKDLLPAD